MIENGMVVHAAMYDAQQKPRTLLDNMRDAADDVEKQIRQLVTTRDELIAAFEQAQLIVFDFREGMITKIREQYDLQIESRRQELSDIRANIARIETEQCA